jgi:hypothetical protein
MARRADPARIHQARRDATLSTLTTAGLTQDDAERWLGLWEAQAIHDPQDRDCWQAGANWIEAERHPSR